MYKILYKKYTKGCTKIYKIGKYIKKLADRRKYRERVYINKGEKETFPKEKKKKKKTVLKSERKTIDTCAHEQNRRKGIFSNL